MLNTADYLELVSEGVDAGLVSLVEGAYRFIFEATDPQSVSVKQVDYVTIARNLGIDISEYISEDGERDDRKIEEKVTADEKFKKLADFVNSVVDKGMDYAGYGYRDTNGAMKYNFAEFNKNMGIRNAITNIQISLLNTVSSHPNIDLDNANIRESLGKKLANELRDKFSGTLDRLIRSEVNDDVDRRIDYDMYEGAAYVSKYDDIQWVRRRDEFGDYLISSDGNRISFDAVYGYVIASCIDITHSYSNTAWRNVLECLALGPLDKIAIPDDYLSSCYDLDAVVSSLPTEVIVNLFRRGPDFYDAIVQELRAENYEPWNADLLCAIKTIVEAYDAGGIDGDDVADIVNHADDDGYVTDTYGMELQGIINENYGPMYQIDFSTLTDVLDLPDVLSGKQYETKRERPASDSRSDTGIRNKSTDDGVRGTRLLSLPEIQWKIYRREGAEGLRRRLYSLFSNTGYAVPIVSSLMDLIFRSSDRNYLSMLNVVALYSNYIQDLFEKSPLNNVVSRDSRNAERIMDDVRKYITPRVQREMANHPDNHQHDTLIKNFIRFVPGFRVDPDSSEKSDESRTAISYIYMPTVTFLALLHRSTTARSFSDDRLMYGSISPDVIDDIYHKTPDGLRIAERMLQMLSNETILVSVFDYIRNEFDDSQMERFLSTYIVPNRTALAPTVAEIMSRGNNPVLYQFMVKVCSTFSKSDGKRPSIGSMLFLSRGSWFDFKSRAWRSEEQVTRAEVIMIHILPSIVDWDRCPIIAAIALSSLGDRDIIHDIMSSSMGWDSKYMILKNALLMDTSVSRLSNGSNHLIQDDAFDRLITDANAKPMLIGLLNFMSSERKKRAAEICFSPEYMESLSSTVDGMGALIMLSKDTGLGGFSSQFILSHKNKIHETLESLLSRDAIGPEEAERLRNELFGRADRLKQEGGKVNDGTLGRVEYSVANGLRWMTGFVKLDSGLSGVGGKCTLFSREEAAKFIASLGEDSPWRLPTADELANLGDAGTIKKLGLGFSDTGKGNSDGEFDEIYDSACYAWYANGGTLGGYSVSYDMINIDDTDIEDGDYLAIKLVSRA